MKDSQSARSSSLHRRPLTVRQQPRTHLESAKMAKTLLKRLRQTPMRRGAISRPQRQLRDQVSRMIGRHGVPTSIAERVAFQLVFKFEAAELGDASVWSAIGDVLRQEIERLKSRVGLVDRQIVTALPKLSAVHVEEFFHELQLADRTIARTILNSALDAAQPLTAGRRYLAQYCSVTEQLMAVAPDVARTMANATFHAGVPRTQAMKHYTTLAGLMKKFQNVSDVAPMIAKAAF